MLDFRSVTHKKYDSSSSSAAVHSQFNNEENTNPQCLLLSCHTTNSCQHISLTKNWWSFTQLCVLLMFHFIKHLCGHLCKAHVHTPPPPRLSWISDQSPAESMALPYQYLPVAAVLASRARPQKRSLTPRTHQLPTMSHRGHFTLCFFSLPL